MKATLAGLPCRLEFLATRRALWRTTALLSAIVRTDGPKPELRFVNVPLGWVCDLASVPWPLRKEGPWTPAALLHGVLYARGRWQLPPSGNVWEALSREQADLVYLAALEALGVSPLRRRILYGLARAGGWRAWRRYRQKASKRTAGAVRRWIAELLQVEH